MSKVMVIIDIPDNLQKPEEDGTLIVDESFLKRYVEDDSFFVFELPNKEEIQ